MVQFNGAKPHVGKDAPQDLQRAEREQRCDINLATRPAQSPDLDINDLGVSNSMKTEFGRRRTMVLWRIWSRV